MGERARNWCKHYNGTVNDTCKVGVRYKDVEKRGDTGPVSLPCFRGVNHEGKPQNPLGATCEKCQFRTPEEIAAEEAESKARWERIGAIRKAIVETCGGPWKKGMQGSAGTIECPACKRGTVSFSRSGYNGHIHARCSTPNCASWME